MKANKIFFLVVIFIVIAASGYCTFDTYLNFLMPPLAMDQSFSASGISFTGGTGLTPPFSISPLDPPHYLFVGTNCRQDLGGSIQGDQEFQEAAIRYEQFFLGDFFRETLNMPAEYLQLLRIYGSGSLLGLFLRPVFEIDDASGLYKQSIEADGSTTTITTEVPIIDDQGVTVIEIVKSVRQIDLENRKVVTSVTRITDSGEEELLYDITFQHESDNVYSIIKNSPQAEESKLSFRFYDNGYVLNLDREELIVVFDEDNSSVDTYSSGRSDFFDNVIFSRHLQSWSYDREGLHVKNGSLELVYSDLEMDLFDGSIADLQQALYETDFSLDPRYQFNHWTSVRINGELVDAWYDTSCNYNNEFIAMARLHPHMEGFSWDNRNNSPVFTSAELMVVGQHAVNSATFHRVAFAEAEDAPVRTQVQSSKYNSQPGSAYRLFYSAEGIPLGWGDRLSMIRKLYYATSNPEIGQTELYRYEKALIGGTADQLVLRERELFDVSAILSGGITSSELPVIERYQEYLIGIGYKQTRADNFIISHERTMIFREGVEEVLSATLGLLDYLYRTSRDDIKEDYNPLRLGNERIVIDVVADVESEFLRRGFSYFGTGWSLPGNFVQFSIEFRSFIDINVVPELRAFNVPHEWDFETGRLVIEPFNPILEIIKEATEEL